MNVNEPITIAMIVGVVTKYFSDDIKALLDKYANGRKWALGVKLQAVVGAVAMALVYAASLINGLGIEFDLQVAFGATAVALGWRQVTKHAKK